MTRHKSLMRGTVQLLAAIKEHPEGISASALSEKLGRNVQSPVSKLFAYGVIERIFAPRNFHGRIGYLYRTKLPKVSSPPAADVESPCVASQPAGME